MAFTADARKSSTKRIFFCRFQCCYSPIVYLGADGSGVFISPVRSIESVIHPACASSRSPAHHSVSSFEPCVLAARSIISALRLGTPCFHSWYESRASLFPDVNPGEGVIGPAIGLPFDRSWGNSVSSYSSLDVSAQISGELMPRAGDSSGRWLIQRDLKYVRSLSSFWEIPSAVTRRSNIRWGMGATGSIAARTRWVKLY